MPNNTQILLGPARFKCANRLCFLDYLPCRFPASGHENADAHFLQRVLRKSGIDTMNRPSPAAQQRTPRGHREVSKKGRARTTSDNSRTT
jgi:hypothetical protein